MLPKHVKIIDSGQAVARQTKSILEQHHLLNTQTSSANNQFYTNGNVTILDAILDHQYKVEYLQF